MSKVKCKFHDDRTASMELYPDGRYFCFGCSAAGAISDLGLPTPHGEKYVEDLDATLRYIVTLPVGQVRGLQLPCDADSYYIVWPDKSFYNRRFFEPKDRKYKCPSGHSKRLFWASWRPVEVTTVVVVEGEINALSLARAEMPDVDICSPGGAGDFYSSTADKHLQTYLQYATIVLVADKDAAGAIATIQLKSNLLALGAKDVRIKLVDVDANDVLVNSGYDGIKKEMQEILGMQTWVQSYKDSL